MNEIKTTTYFNRLIREYNAGFRRIVSMGGTSSSKTYSELQLLYFIATARNRKGKPVSISVVSESLPHLKLGAIRDFDNILRSYNAYNENHIDFSNRVYWFGSSFIEFFSADMGKATGPRRDILLLNEVNNIPRQVVIELSQRTNETIFYDFNPTEEFWITDEVFSLPETDFKLLKSNHTDNDYLPDTIRRDIILRAERDPNYKRIHIDVEFGSAEGLIYPEWQLCDTMPESSKRLYGMDFGFTNDPSTIVDVCYQNGELWLDELLYERGQTPEQLDQFIRNNCNRYYPVIADSSEPQMIDYLFRKGNRIMACKKGKDSISSGIELIKQYKVNVTKRSVNLIKERRSYRYATDKNGISFNEPQVGQQDHALDAVRYAVQELLNPQKKSAGKVIPN